MTRTAPALVMTYGTGMALNPQRIHRATCKRLISPERLPAAADVNLSTLAHAKPASCCKPGRAAIDLIDRAVAELAALPPVVPAMTASEPGTGELAGGDVQALPQSARPRVRKGNRHDQRNPLPGSTVATAEGVVIAQQRHLTLAPPVEVTVTDEQRCTGACGQLLPLVKFPTIDSSRRGTECRADRDARRAAAKAAK